MAESVLHFDYGHKLYAACGALRQRNPTTIYPVLVSCLACARAMASNAIDNADLKWTKIHTQLLKVKGK